MGLIVTVMLLSRLWKVSKMQLNVFSVNQFLVLGVIQFVQFSLTARAESLSVTNNYIISK